VVAVAAATFVLSYSGVHAVALRSGVSASLASYYPGVFDAVLVIACAAAPLRDARLWTRVYTWLVIFIVIGLLAAMDAVQAMGVVLPRRQTAGTVAVLPWVLVLLAFTLWLVVLRHFRVQQSRQLSQVPSNAPGLLTTPESPATLGLPAARQAPALPPGPGDPPASGEAAGRDSEPITEQGPADGDYPQASGPAPAADQLPGATPDGTTPDGTTPDGTTPDEATPDEVTADDSAPPGPASADPAQDPVPDEAGQPGESDGIPEVGGVPYATGPRLRRVRSLPVPPADDDE
jgi:hypothetical protein